jgi:hypothetical protein
MYSQANNNFGKGYWLDDKPFFTNIVQAFERNFGICVCMCVCVCVGKGVCVCTNTPTHTGAVHIYKL